MTLKPKIIVAGYGSWQAAELNPCAQIVQQLKPEVWGNCDLLALEFDVVSGTLEHRIEKLLLEERPHAWLGLGINSGPASSVVRAEKIGINYLHFGVPDNNGAQPDMRPIVGSGPVAYAADYPYEACVEEMKRQGIPAAISLHAGAHMCNQMIYLTRHLVEKHKLQTVSGFLHMPRSTESVARMKWPQDCHPTLGLEVPSLALDMMIQATRIAINSACGGKTDG